MDRALVGRKRPLTSNVNLITAFSLCVRLRASFYYTRLGSLCDGFEVVLEYLLGLKHSRALSQARCGCTLGLGESEAGEPGSPGSALNPTPSL